MQGSRRRRWWVAGALILGLAVAWWIWGSHVLAWYYVRQLAQADEASRAVWLTRVVDQGEASVSPLLGRLEAGEGGQAVVEALERLAQRWGPQDARSLRLSERLGDIFAKLSPAGRKGTLNVVVALLQSEREAGGLPAPLEGRLGDMMAAAAGERMLRRETLLLAAGLLGRSAGADLELYRGLALAGLEDDHPATRVAAVQLLLRPALKQEGLLARIVPLLRDPDAPVRRAAVIALGTAKDVVGEDELLPLLHDPDQEVQAACELALRSRGLEESHLLLARLISDDRPGARLQVLQHLGQARDLEPGVWLRRLTQDPAPAVRAAAIRAAASQNQVDLRDRLREMATGDPSPTVRQLAGHYLERMPR